MDFSYGFRTGRGQHHALDALSVANADQSATAAFLDNLIEHIAYHATGYSHHITKERVFQFVHSFDTYFAPEACSALP
jgi:hypothetical protein